MTGSRSNRVNRRQLVASSVLGGAAALVTGQPLLAGSTTRQSGAFLPQSGSSAVSLLPMNATETGTKFDASNGVEILWTFEVGEAISLSDPVVRDGVVYVGASEYLYAFDARSGDERWRFAMQLAPGSRSVITVVDEEIYVGSSEGDLFVLRADDGAELWRFSVDGGSARAPAVEGEVIYVGIGDQYLYALNAEDGTERWRFLTGGMAYLPVVVGEIVCVWSRDLEEETTLYAVNVSDGTEWWRLQGVSASVVAEGVAYVVMDGSDLYAVNVADGTERWRFETVETLDPNQSSIVRGLSLMNGMVYAQSRGGDLYALNADDGTERWRLKHTSGYRRFRVVDEVVCIADITEGYLYGIDAISGAERWRLAIEGYEYNESDLSVMGADAVVMTNASVGLDVTTYRAVNAEDGAELWQFELEGLSYVPPVESDGIMFVKSNFRKLYAIGARAPQLSVGGTARVTEKTSLRGGPTPTAIERAVLEPNTVVTITDGPESSNDSQWWLVLVEETGVQGWIEASKLEPLTSGPEPS